jgi:hypothetical protein
MPMKEAKQHGGGDPKNPYCVFCTDASGKLKPKSVIREGMVALFMRKKRVDSDVAEKLIDGYMAKLPAWKKKK